MPTIEGTPTSNFDETIDTATESSHSHTVTADTKLLLVFLASSGQEESAAEWADPWVQWNGITMTKIGDSGVPVDGGDRYAAVFGIINPSSATGNVVVDLDAANTFANGFAVAAVNIAGINNASLAAAVNFLEGVQDNSGGTSVLFASAGDAPNGLMAFWCIRGFDHLQTSADTAGFAKLFASDIGTGGSSAGACISNVYYDLDGAASDCAASGAGTSDENAGVYIELVAGVVITNVDTDDIVDPTQTPWTIAGSGFGAD